MKRVKVYSWLLMAVGLSLLVINLVNSGITGFVIGAASSSGNWQQSFFTLVLGMTFFFVGFFVFMVSSGDLEKMVGVNYYSENEDYKNLKKQLKQKGTLVERNLPSDPKITLKEYVEFLKSRDYDQFDAEFKGAYNTERHEFLNINKKSKKNRYLNKVLNEIITHDSERAKEIREVIDRKNNPSAVTNVFISEQAIDRSNKDSFISSNIDEYFDEISKIYKLPLSRPTHPIGPFRVSPRGNKKIRVAWHYQKNPSGEEEIYIDDLLYHVTDKDYNDNWINRVASGAITLGSYGGYKPFN